jgi:putative transposase
MNFSPQKNIRLPRDQYIGRRIYLVTVCCKGRRPVFALSRRCEIAIETLRTVSTAMHFLVHAYCIMPDHVHFLVEGATETSDLHALVTRWKQRIGYRLRLASVPELWQERYYDHILRKAEDADGVAWYIWMNPVRKGLVDSPAQYPFSGSFTVEWPKSPMTGREWRPPWRESDKPTAD